MNVKKLLSYGSLLISEHNNCLLLNYEFVDSYRHESVSNSGLKVFVSKDNSTEKTEVKNVSTPG